MEGAEDPLTMWKAVSALKGNGVRDIDLYPLFWLL